MARQTICFSDNDMPSIESYSQLQYFTVAQDLRMEQKPIKQRYRDLIKDYSKFILTKKVSLKPEEVNLLDQMFISRFNNLLNQLEDDLSKGRLLSSLLMITDTPIRKAADLFSREYRKLLKARQTVGYIPKINQQKVDDTYKLLIAELRKKVFAPVINMFDDSELTVEFSWKPADLPDTISTSEEDAAILTSSTAGFNLSQLYDRIVGFLRAENINAKVDITDGVIKVTPEENKEQSV